MSGSSRAQKLLALLDLVNAAEQVVVREWEKEDQVETSSITASDSDASIPSHELFAASRTIIAACGSFAELLMHPEHLISEVSLGFLQARALQIAAENRVADVLANAGHDKVVSTATIGAEVGIDPPKLERILRTLCSAHIFTEVSEGLFANNTVSSYLVGNKALRARLIVQGSLVYGAAKELPTVLKDPVKGSSTSAAHSALSHAIGRDVPFWDWLEEDVPQPDGTTKANPMLETFGLAMVGAGRSFMVAIVHDYPWQALGSGTVVDVGGGLGTMSLELAKTYPNLNFIVQDRSPVLEKASALWEKENPEALRTRCTMMPHNFFEGNPVKGATAYLLRYIMHDWDDDSCVRILSSIKASMSAESRILIADLVVVTTAGGPEITRAPAPLLPNYGIWTRYTHAGDMNMMVCLNGVERAPAQFQSLAKRAGLDLIKIWECRGLVHVVEMRLPQKAN